MRSKANPVKLLSDRTRSLLGIRRNRKVTSRRSKPRIGSQIILGDVRMSMQAGMSEELWNWLQDAGWRENMFRPDRRRYREIPSTWVTRLIDCAPADRAHYLSVAVSKAAFRSSVEGPAVLRTSMQRK
jgi:hypothetical protein